MTKAELISKMHSSQVVLTKSKYEKVRARNELSRRRRRPAYLLNNPTHKKTRPENWEGFSHKDWIA